MSNAREGKKAPKLQTLKPRIALLGSRIQPLSTRATTRKRGSAGVKDRHRVRERDSDLCQLCLAAGRITPATIVDHRVPLWAGGSDEDDNKQVVCPACHEEKSARESMERAGR